MFNECIPVTNIHTNGFIDINGYPYLLAEYLDKRNFQQLDNSMINNYVKIDQTEEMRAIVDISVDNVGKNSDGSISALGNNTKQINLLQMIERNINQLGNKLPVLRKGLIARISYRLENNTTGEVIRSTTEDFRIPKANYYLNINSKNINDNALIANFNGSTFSTMNYFTNGRDPMILRIMNLDIFYEVVKSGMKLNDESIKIEVPPTFGNEMDILTYHQLMGGNYKKPSYGVANTETIIPPQWIAFNNFYHFDNSAQDIILHNEEIYDDKTETALVPCISMVINRAMIINPAHRIIFKFNIWRNDVTMFNNTTSVAEALRAQYVNPYYNQYGYPYPNDDYNTRPPYHPHHPYSNEELLALLRRNTMADYKQNEVINQMNNAITELTKTVKQLKGDNSETPSLPKLPEKPYNRDEVIEKLLELIAEQSKKIDELEKKIKDLEKPKPPAGGTGGEGNVGP